MLLQLPEQREAAESEIRVHKRINHPNVVHLVDSEIRSTAQKQNDSIEGIAFLVFPYYRVSLAFSGCCVLPSSLLVLVDDHSLKVPLQ